MNRAPNPVKLPSVNLVLFRWTCLHVPCIPTRPPHPHPQPPPPCLLHKPDLCPQPIHCQYRCLQQVKWNGWVPHPCNSNELRCQVANSIWSRNQLRVLRAVWIETFSVGPLEFNWPNLILLLQLLQSPDESSESWKPYWQYQLSSDSAWDLLGEWLIWGYS